MESNNNQQDQLNNKNLSSKTSVSTNTNQQTHNFTPLPKKLQTEENKSHPKTYPELDEKYRLAIDMRLLGYRYYVIGKRLTKAGMPTQEQTVASWFMKDGMCYKVFEDMKAIRIEELKKSIDEAKNQISEGVVDAIAVLRQSLVNALENGDITPEAYSNAKDMLDRGGFPKQTKNDFSGKIESDGLIAMASAIRSVLEPNNKN